jgi:hypothetical protein
MIKFNKDLNLRIIIALTVSFLFLFTGIAYSCPKDSLRVPVGQKSTSESMIQEMREAIKKKLDILEPAMRIKDWMEHSSPEIIQKRLEIGGAYRELWGIVYQSLHKEAEELLAAFDNFLATQDEAALKTLDEALGKFDQYKKDYFIRTNPKLSAAKSLGDEQFIDDMLNTVGNPLTVSFMSIGRPDQLKAFIENKQILEDMIEWLRIMSLGPDIRHGNFNGQNQLRQNI